MANKITGVLDLFAGTGVGVACQNLGIPEYGVEIWEPAYESRRAAGMTTPYRDVLDVEKAGSIPFNTLWASPPCQTFSVAGLGLGRAELDKIIRAVREGVWGSPDSLRSSIKEFADGRSPLVLAPMTYLFRYRPENVVFEQVPEVLPIWESMAEEMEELGYSTWTGILDSADYGVPQQRKRAILVARSGGKVATPPPTQERVPMSSFKTGEEGLISNYSSRGKKSITVPGNKLPRGYRTIEEPAFTATSKVTSQRWYPSMDRVSQKEAAMMQTYPKDFTFHGNLSDIRTQIGNAVPPKLAEAILKQFM